MTPRQSKAAKFVRSRYGYSLMWLGPLGLCALRHSVPRNPLQGTDRVMAMPLYCVHPYPPDPKAVRLDPKAGVVWKCHAWEWLQNHESSRTKRQSLLVVDVVSSPLPAEPLKCPGRFVCLAALCAPQSLTGHSIGSWLRHCVMCIFAHLYKKPSGLT